MPLAPGTLLGPYEIQSVLGTGGMGEVYKARDRRLERMVAIKVSHEQFSIRFDREARAIAQLNHPHICQLYDVGPDYLVMDVGLADHYFASTTFGHADTLVPRARSLAQRALELDADLPEAHAMLGVLARFYNPDWEEAQRRFRVAMAGESVPWHVRSWYSNFFLSYVGRKPSGLERRWTKRIR